MKTGIIILKSFPKVRVKSLFKIKFLSNFCPSFQKLTKFQEDILKKIGPINSSISISLDRRKVEEGHEDRPVSPRGRGGGKIEEGVHQEATENASIGLCIATRSHYKRAAPVKAIIGCKAA